ncbi:hypothetical protein HanXRQr2_Chr13g0570331 [Helianthus annuus]|uniref:Uncharacterized protein n=1 Tax=Helianthus annuus TaxID=4232 RepID=A0A9K3EEG1_HELAN|nr:hypothetical protein HanXRQr2_Chr13g0570331 [Helianthus annuus]KAJ0847774.1 hypothetical protein HanPSC8_Chr13g0549141 [Helianthus annuus]
MFIISIAQMMMSSAAGVGAEGLVGEIGRYRNCDQAAVSSYWGISRSNRVDMELLYVLFLYTTQVPHYLEGENYVFSGGREVINVFSILCIIQHFSYTSDLNEKDML